MMFVNLRRCKCGCGNKVETSNGWSYGHWNVGIVRSNETKSKMSSWQLGVKKGKNEKLSIVKRGKRLPDEVYKKAARTRVEQGVFKKEKNPMWNPDREGVRIRGLMYRAQNHMLKRVMKRFGTKKENHTDEQLGYSTEQLRRHLESQFLPGMSWDNYGMGPGHWNIDHIREVKTFSISDDIAKINALSNLRPLWWEDNIARNRKS